MNSSQITLKEFFALQDKDLKKDRLSKIESSEKLKPVKEKAQEQAKEIKWFLLFKESIKKTNDLLNIVISKDIMGKAWNQFRLLIKYLDKVKYSPDDTYLVTLVEHTIKSEHKPYLEIFIDDVLIGKITFNITVALTFKGLNLKIKNGKIIEIQTDSCIGKGSIKCENFPLFERKTAPFTLLGSIKLVENINIANG